MTPNEQMKPVEGVLVLIMKLVSFIVILSFTIVLYGYFSNVLHNDIVNREVVHKIDQDRDRITPGDQPDNLFWVVQVSDIHVSKFRDFNRAPDLQKFCETHLSVIKPDFVIASGDLTDSKYKDQRGSTQFIEEWKTYHETVKKCQKFVELWLDQRGNHDAFDIPDFDHKNNLFRLYSAQGKDHPSTYVYHHQKPYGRYSFIAVDATPNPGPKRPFNFFGYIRKDGESIVQKYIEESRNSNMTVGFGHYPTSVIATESGTSVRQLLRNVTAYLCGHLHTLGGLVPEMYARHPTGSIELEVGDWKDNRRYRILAVDHDMISFSDETLDKWPAVVVTNPKRAALLAPYHEPVHRIINSTHIRVLIFTPGQVSNAELYIDDAYLGKAVQSSGPLYVAAWQPTKYRTGLHTLRIAVQDSLGNELDHKHVFSLDGTSPLFALSGRFILMMDSASVAHVLFFLLVGAYMAVLIVLRNCNNIKPHYFSGTSCITRPLSKWYNTWVYRVWLVCKTPKLFSSLLAFILYLAIGPWFIGEMLEGHTGVVFVWGMYVHWSYLPVCLTYVYGIVQVMMFNIPLLLYLGYLLHYAQVTSLQQTLMHQLRHIYVPLLVLVGFTSYVALAEFPAAYGTRAFLIGPVRTGSVILSVYLFFVARSTNVLTSIGSHGIRSESK